MLSLAIQSCGNTVLLYTPLPCQSASRKTFKSLVFSNPKCSLVNSSPIFHRSSGPISRNQRFRNFAAQEALAAEYVPDEEEEYVPDGEEESVPDEEEESVPDEEEEYVSDEEEESVSDEEEGWERDEEEELQFEKPRLALKFIWMEKNVGLALDQMIPGYGTVPLSPYYFWPRKDAWEELKTILESKPWISQKRMILLLNQATDIINYWQQSGGNLTQ